MDSNPDELGGGGDATFPQLPTNLKLPPDPELDNFLRQADDVFSIVKGLASKDEKEQERALRKADIFLHQKDIGDDTNPDQVKCKVTQDRSQINKIPDEDPNEGQGDMSQKAFMAAVEKDAKERAENRKLRKKESDEYRKKGNIAFSQKNYAAALCNYNKAIALIKDSPCLYNNRALTYLRTNCYSSAIEDCEKALDLEFYSFRARMYKAKALFLLGEAEKCRMELEKAREILPGHIEIIDEYEQEIFEMGRKKPTEDIFSDQEKVWRDAANFTGEFSSKNCPNLSSTTTKKDSSKSSFAKSQSDSQVSTDETNNNKKSVQETKNSISI